VLTVPARPCASLDGFETPLLTSANCSFSCALLSFISRRRLGW
jgi:hypothetical protein